MVSPGLSVLEPGLIYWLHRHDWRFWMTGNQRCSSTRGKDRSGQLVLRNRQVQSQRGNPLPHGTCQGAVIPSRESKFLPPPRMIWMSELLFHRVVTQINGVQLRV